ERKVLTRAGVRAKEYGGDISPKISPDGSRVLFLRTPGPRTMHEFADLMSVGADGTGVERILASGRAKRDDYLYDFAWSHDGTEVFLLRARDNSKGQRLTIHFDLI